MFGMQAQAQTDCCFSLFNPSGDTIHDLVNVPGGDLPQNHSMNLPEYQHTDVYELQFSDTNCLSIDYTTGKVSIELELWLDGENVLDGNHNLNRICDITMQTTYNELHWVGSPMIGSNYPYAFEYPGAVKIFSGTYNISNVNYDYFFFNFLVNSQTKVIITWKQAYHDAVLIAHVRERIHGTNHEFYWDDQQRLNVGGHQSHPVSILASDTISTEKYYEGNDTINDCEPYPVGMPLYIMDTSGTYKVAYLDTTGCNDKVDSIITYVYKHYVHPTTPTLHDSTYRYCQKGTATPIVLPAEPNTSLTDVVPYWYFADLDSFIYAPSFTPVTDTAPGTYDYYVKRHDNVTGCESAIDTFHVTINQNPNNPVVANPIVEYCVGATAVPLAYTAPIGMQVIWGNDPDIDSLSPTPITPSTAAAAEKIYYLRLMDTTTVNRCVSEGYDSIIVKVFANPVVTITHDRDSLCYNETVTLTATPNNLSTYAWSKNGVVLPNDTLYTMTDTNKTAVEAFTKYSLDVTVKHDSVNCAANVLDSVKVYPLMGTPSPVRGDTAICGPGTVTLQVAAGTNGTTAKWYKADKTQVLATDTLVCAVYFSATDSVFVSTLNDKGCETPVENWLKITVRVDTIPTVTLSAPNNAEVCAESDMIIHSTVVPAYTPLTYAWSGTGLQDPKTEDSVRFNHGVRGQYIDTLWVRDNHGCYGMDTILVTVDSLPVIAKPTNYTVKDNEFCVGANGKIEFLTPDYVRYSIDSGATWRYTTKVFDTLKAKNYGLIVEDGNGCKNHMNVETIIDVTVMPALTITDTANTRCLPPFNGKLVVSAAPATGAYKYQKDGGAAQTDSVFVALENGTYNITVTDTVTGCKTDSLNQVVTDGKVIPALHMSSTVNTHCYPPYDGVIKIDSVTPNTGAYHYRISDPTPLATPYQVATEFTGLINAFYTVTVEDTLTACLGSDTITVLTNDTPPTATVIGTDHVCYPDTNTVFYTSITEPNVVFLNWDYIGSVPDSTINTFRTKDTIKLKNYNTGAAFPPGTHILISHIRDTLTHCEALIMDTVRVIAVNIELFTDPSTTVCEYDTVKVYCKYIKADPTDSIVSYSWFNGNHIDPVPGADDTVLVIPTNTASYVSLVVTDNHNCPGAFGKTISVWELPKISITGDTAYCKDETTNILATVTTVNNPPIIEWFRNGSSVLGPVTATFSTLTTEVVDADFILEIKAKDTKGCKNSTTRNIKAYTIPAAPVFNPDSMYFCTEAEIAGVAPTTTTPAGSTLNWVTTDPNVTKQVGSYAAFYRVVAQEGHNCDSQKDTVHIFVPGKPVFNIDLKYNSEIAASTSKARCYDPTAGDTVKVNVTTTAVGTMTYTYTRNHETPQNSANVVITQTNAGTYADTIKISAHQVYPDNSFCDWDTTVYYTLTINPLPTAPTNFPSAYNSTNDSIIFYCQGSTANYTFATQANVAYTYSPGGLVKPTVAGTYKLIETNTLTNCVDSFPYKIVEVPTPNVLVANKASDKNCGQSTISDTITATFTNFPPVDASYTRFYVWHSNVTAITPDSVAKTANADTLYYDFSYLDTMVTVKVGLYAANGDYTATCYKTPVYDTVKVLFQALPDRPKLKPTYTYYVDSANAAYCAGDLTIFSLTAADFVTIPGATINIVGHPTGIDTAGVYKVVANNNTAPNCPGDTLTLYVREKRTPAEPTNIGAGKYDYKVYFCKNTTPWFEFEKANAQDTFMYKNTLGGDFVASKPDSAGTYTLRIMDKIDTCYRDVNFDIIEVANPNWTVSLSWSDTNICQTDSIYIMNYTPSITQNYTPTAGVTQKPTYSWDGVESTTISSHSYNFGVSKDTMLIFAYTEYDTIGNMGYGVSCAYSGWRDTINLRYFSTPAVPVYNGLTDFCLGDSIVVAVDSFTVANPTTDTLYATITLPVTYKVVGTYNFNVQAQYKTFAACKSNTNTITITGNNLPSVHAVTDKAQICFEGDTATLSVGTGSTATSYLWSTATIDSVAAATSIKVTDTVKYYLKGTDANNCVGNDSVKVVYYPVFTVELSGDTSVCVDSSATIRATASGGSGSFTFNWYKADQYSSADLGSATGTYAEVTVTPDSSIKVEGVVVPSVYKVKVTDTYYNCVSDSASNVVNISSFTGAQIVFTEHDSSKSIRSMSVEVNQAKAFDMYIKDQGGCPCEETDSRVYIDYQLYRNDVALTDAELPDYMDAIALLAPNNTSYEFDLTVAAPFISSMQARVSFYTASGIMPDQSRGRFLNNYDPAFDWLYMHFLLGQSDGMGGHNGRKIKVTTGMWKPGSEGVYKFSYAVIKEGGNSGVHTLIYDVGKRVGGQGRIVTADTIIYDYFTINVVPEGSLTTDNFAPSVITPAPEEYVVEKAMDMKVYPNPASNNVNVVLEGISGQTMITIHDMSGKVVNNMRVEIDSDVQTINLPVENFSQGIYFIKAVNDKAVMTKKLIIAR